eukprot:CAMPEP_0176132288 /NCGR_PEP_ID=MMETSP0120_2-20121206/66997_1 /TAXON_ID=160619 /ORGANISM="Kryptoperidinium foliaceum, Strain CCMP 1326" /LENGTH=53 /DNA_ID=CAMNT_0017467727 /DNA_START=69 /DNA_END=227 /DNA_ORIENTATION=+
MTLRPQHRSAPPTSAAQNNETMPCDADADTMWRRPVHALILKLIPAEDLRVGQ